MMITRLSGYAAYQARYTSFKPKAAQAPSLSPAAITRKEYESAVEVTISDEAKLRFELSKTAEGTAKE